MNRHDVRDDGALHSTAELLVRIRDGDDRARETLAARYLAMLGRWAHGRLPAKARGVVDTDDIVQTALIDGLRALRTFEPRGEGAFLAYLRQIVLNRIRDAARRVRSRPTQVGLDESLDAADGASPLEDLIGRDQLLDYERALLELNQPQRGSVILRLELGMRYRDIAEAMELPSAEAARALIGRGMVRLARLMRSHHE